MRLCFGTVPQDTLLLALMARCSPKGCLIRTTVQYSRSGRGTIQFVWGLSGPVMASLTHVPSLSLVFQRLIPGCRNSLGMKSYITRWFSLIKNTPPQSFARLLQTYCEFEAANGTLVNTTLKGSVNARFAATEFMKKNRLFLFCRSSAKKKKKRKPNYGWSHYRVKRVKRGAQVVLSESLKINQYPP